MKKILPFLAIFFSFFSSVHANEYYMTWGWWGSPECLAWINTSIQQYTFWNTYNWWLSEWDTKTALNRYLLSKCWLYSVWADTSSITGVLIPLYQPRTGVSGFYEIHTWSYILSETLFYLSSILDINLNNGNKFIAGFYGGVVPYAKMPMKMNNEAYLASLKPPFSTAYMTQWYIYLGRPMLVARNSSLQVTDVFIQNPLSHKNQKEIAKRFLWEKWYHP